MSLDDLDNEDKAIILNCLNCVASGKVILHDWEFPLIMGLEVSEFLAIVGKWPEVDDQEELVFLTINNAINNLLGYPHKQDLGRFIQASRSEILRVFHKWKKNHFAG